MARIALVHTARAHIETFDALLRDSDLGATVDEAVHEVHEDWLARARDDLADTALVAEVSAGLRAAAAAADVVLCTCSTLGPIAAALDDPRILRIDGPVMRMAVAHAGTVLLVLCLQSTLAASREVLLQAFAAAKRAPDFRVLLCSQAWSAYEAGDTDLFAQRITDAVARDVASAGPVGAVVLGQASMAVAAERLSALGFAPLATPELALTHALASARAAGRSS